MADEQLRMTARVEDQFSGPLRKLRDQLRGVAQNDSVKAVSKDWGKLRESIGNVTKDVRDGLMPSLGGLGMTSLSVGGAMAGVALSVVNFSGRLKQLKLTSQETGASVGQLRAFTQLGERFGVSADTMGGSIRTLSANMFELRKNWGEAYTQLRGMNLGDLAKDLAGSANMDQAIERALEGLAKIPDPIIRQRAARLLFGTDDISIIAGALGKDVGKVFGEVRSSIGDISPATLRAGEDFEKSMNRMKESAERLKVEGLGPLLPAITELMEKGRETVGGMFSQDLKDIEKIKEVAEKVSKWWDGFGKIEEIPLKEKVDAIDKKIAAAQAQAGDAGMGTPIDQDRQRRARGEVSRLEEQKRMLTEAVKEGVKGALDDPMAGDALTGGSGSNGLSGGAGGDVLMNARAAIRAGAASRRSAASGSDATADGPVAPFKGTGTTFDQKAPEIMDRLMQDHGLNKEEAGIVLGNLGHESGGFKHMQELKPLIPGSLGGYGWAQWTGPRRREFNKWADENNLARDSDAANYGFLSHELRGTHKGALQALKSAKTRDAKMLAFEQRYEGAGIKNYRSRFNYADRAVRAHTEREASQASSPSDELMANAKAAGVIGGGSNKVEGAATLDINLNGFPQSVRTRTSMDGLFKEVSLKQGKSMQMTDD